MNNLMKFEGNNILFLTKDMVNVQFEGDFLVSGKDVAVSLGYERPNDAVNTHVDQEEKHKIKNSNILDTVKHSIRKLNNAGEIFVTESGMYELIFGSKLEQAKRFKKWVTKDILPQLRQTGVYVAKPQSIEDLIILQAESMKEVKLQLAETKGLVQTQKQELTTIKETLIHTKEDWRKWINKQLKKIAKAWGGENEHYQQARTESYELLEEKAKCLLSIRLKNLKERMSAQGASKTAIRKANNLDIIESDQKLKEIYTSIIEKMSIKYLGGADQ